MTDALVSATELAMMSPAQMAEEYQKIISLKDAVEERYKFIREKLLEVTKQNGVVSLKTEKFTITRQSRTTVKVTDQKQAIAELEARNIEVVTKVVLDDDVMKPVYKELCKTEEIPGITAFTTEFVSVRLAKVK